MRTLRYLVEDIMTRRRLREASMKTPVFTLVGMCVPGRVLQIQENNFLWVALALPYEKVHRFRANLYEVDPSCRQAALQDVLRMDKIYQFEIVGKNEDVLLVKIYDDSLYLNSTLIQS